MKKEDIVLLNIIFKMSTIIFVLSKSIVKINKILKKGQPSLVSY